MAIESGKLLYLLAAWADPAHRRRAADDLARELGCRGFALFAPDPDLGIMLPVPGLPQTLNPAAAWRRFVDRTHEQGRHEGQLPGPDGAPLPARGVARRERFVAVAIGECKQSGALESLLPLFELLASLFRSEQRAASAEARAAVAAEAAQRADSLAARLATMRDQLSAALGAAERAQAEAREQAAQAQALAEELQVQRDQLEEQAAELEIVNAELSERTEEAMIARADADAANSAKSRFLASMSHELRTPINAIVGYCDLLASGIGGPVTPEQGGYLERVRVSSTHLLTLVNDVLDLAKVEAGQMAVESMHGEVAPAVVEAIALVAIQAAERGIAIDDDCVQRQVRYAGDQARVRQILTNLLSNAVKFTEPGGQITITCGTADHAAPDAQLRSGGPWTWIEVADTGIGMTPDDLARVFRPFVQAAPGSQPAQPGTGLGLTISRQLARLMGGDLTARSTIGVGSAFTVWLATEPVPAGQLDDELRVAPTEQTPGA